MRVGWSTVQVGYGEVQPKAKHAHKCQISHTKPT